MHQPNRLVAGRYRLTTPVSPDAEATCGIAEDEHSVTGTTVLVQQIPLPELVSADDSSVITPDAAAIADSVRAVTHLPLHTNVGEVYDAVPDGDRLWLIQERLTDATPLAHSLTDGPLSPRRAAEIASDLLRALRHLHRLGWHHGALTPETVVVDNYCGRAVLTGLGQAVADDLICGIHRSMPLPPPPAPAVPNSRPPRRVAMTPVPARLVAHSNIAGVAGGIHADTQRRPTAAAWPPLPAEHPRPAPAQHHRPFPEEPPAMTPLEAVRAMQQRITIVGDVVERWAPEQARAITKATPLPAPVGAEADLWALGALLFRTVQGYPPYPEDAGIAELLDAVREEPAAYAEDAGILRPLIEQLLYTDPAKRPSADRALAWLNSLHRDAPEPARPDHAGEPAHQIPSLPIPGKSVVPRVRRHLARRPRPSPPTPSRRARHRQPRPRWRPSRRTVALTGIAAITGLTLIGYALLPGRGHDRQPPTSARTPLPPPPASTTHPQGDPVIQDPAGFAMAVTPGSARRATPRSVVFRRGAIDVTVVPGHDRLSPGETLLDYQAREQELAEVRADPGSTATDVRLVTVGAAPATAEGTYTWTTADDTRRYARTRAVVLGGRVHVLLVAGPDDQRERVDAVYLQGAASYRHSPEASAAGGTPSPMSRTLRTTVRVL
ncbi:hypothetical protein [Streptomyces anthocyanicus]|uniref:hypothetical protein n=1 Tax=Streptomyces anthocyanicus TaxID=68174 RepID=UPI00381C42B3